MAALYDVSNFTGQGNYSATNFNNPLTDFEGGDRFFVKELSIEVTSEKALMHGGADTNPEDVSGHAWGNLNVPVSWARNTFLYQADAIDVNDLNAEDIKFKMVNFTSSVNAITGDALKYRNPKNIIPGEALVYYGAIPFYGNFAANTNPNLLKVNADYVRHVAKELFGFAVTDLFVNEMIVRNSINVQSHLAFHTRIMELVQFSANNTILLNDVPITDLNKAIKDNFPSKVIFKQMLDNVRARFNDIKGPNNEYLHLFANDGSSFELVGNEIYDSTGTRVDPANDQILWHKLPFMVNDMIFFRLRVNPATDQEKMTDKATPVAVRDYRIRLTLVADNDASVSDWTDDGWDGAPKYSDVGETTVA
jgi:hypothetical protein